MDKTTFFNLTYGLFIAAVERDSKLNGCIINTAIQVTAEPAKMSVTISKDNFTSGEVSKKKYLSVSVLTESASMDLIARFGFQSGKTVNKFDNFNYEVGPKNTPYITESTNAVFFLKVDEEVDLGTHITYFCTVDDAKVLSSDPSLTYAYYHKVKKGTTPKNAPSFNDAQPAEQKMYWQCEICGYKHDKETFADDLLCPVCMQSAKAHFKKI